MFFFNDTATTEIYPLSLHDALPISNARIVRPGARRACAVTPPRGDKPLHWRRMDDADVIVVGAGVVRLAGARELAPRGREVLILEAAGRFGTGASPPNSEVIHAGIYHPRGSLKARLCVAGRERLYEFCRERAIAHRRCGKLIVATSEAQLPELTRIAAAARANGVGLTLLSRPQAPALEPRLARAGALHSPLTGIVDSHALMLALLGEAERHGATLVCASTVTRVVLEERAVDIGVNGAEQIGRASCRERV